MPDKKPIRRKYGRLYIIATPIGNLEDVSLRALRLLKEVSLIACEDTRQTIKLLNKYGIKKRLSSYYHPKERNRLPKIIGHLMEGNDVALVSDAGTPGIADPGFPLIREALKQEITVTPIPGPSALTAALSAAGLPTHRFLFMGFAPPKKEAIRKTLESLEAETATLIFYLPSRKLTAFLKITKEILGERRIVVARELTKIHEEFLRGFPSELLRVSENSTPKGELTLLIEGRSRKPLGT